MFINYKTNITEVFILNANLYEKNNKGDWDFLSSEVMFVSYHQGCIAWEWDALCNLKSKSENEVHLQLRIAKLPNDESISGEEWYKYEQIIYISEHIIKMYYERHIGVELSFPLYLWAFERGGVQWRYKKSKIAVLSEQLAAIDSHVFGETKTNGIENKYLNPLIHVRSQM